MSTCVFLLGNASASLPKLQEEGEPKASTDLGAKVFEENCAGCHEGGENIIDEKKSLKKEALLENGFESPQDVQQIVISGKSIMPSFEEILTQEEILAVAEYVWTQAENDWR
ncbi:MAG: c-type cytochrome [Blastocatellia bacterium]|nr:c-type cytochrome [Blastocatellia bacterium]